MGRQPATSRVDGAPAPSRAEASTSLVHSLIVSLRPSQWTKNLVVFAALLFGRELLDLRSFVLAAAAFVIFCALSGVVYLVNDVVDRENDRQHPIKRHRPIASGRLGPRLALGVAIVLAAAALVAAAAVGRGFLLVAAVYLGLLSVYSGPLKHAVIIDVMTIAIGFVLRAVAGAVAIGVPISHWLLVCTILLALFLALSKRRHELVLLQHGATSHRRILQEYSPYLLDQMIAVVAAATLVAYALYTVSPETIDKFGTDRLLLTLPFPIYGIFRYLYLVHQKQGGGSPAEMLLTDRPLLACVALWAVAVGTILYHPFGL
ncbi:MAG: decaprenyl-phosphate phosphoribosyltransferase [Vicinamibacteraceae bacterium]|nr:decaprenyl-phosphate phosphoribosyltransferase [Vicinamibacteraceae bacterium]